MAEAEDLLGVWKPDTMYAPGVQLYDVLVFKEDGTGFLDFSNPDTDYFNEQFRWSLNSLGELQLRGDRIQRFNADRTGIVERPSTLDTVVRFNIRTEHSLGCRLSQVLRTGTCPWSAIADHSLCGHAAISGSRGDIRNLPGFLLSAR